MLIKDFKLILNCFISVTVCLKALREKDGIPDLRRAARFRYSSVSLPEVGFSVLIVVDHSD